MRYVPEEYVAVVRAGYQSVLAVVHVFLDLFLGRQLFKERRFLLRRHVHAARFAPHCQRRHRVFIDRLDVHAFDVRQLAPPNGLLDLVLNRLNGLLFLRDLLLFEDFYKKGWIHYEYLRME